MCGRYTLRRSELARAAFAAISDASFDEFTERPRFNLAPSQELPVVRLNADGRRVIGLAQWGLIPAWTKGPPKNKPINARAETVATSGMFRQAFGRRRCLIPADGFYEWQGAKPPKQPYFMQMTDGGLFGFAGLWERWKPQDAEVAIDTFTIITTNPNELMRPIHNRMPVILRPADYAAWLDRETPLEAIEGMLNAYDPAVMMAYPVKGLVNSPRNDSSECVEPIDALPTAEPTISEV